MLEYNYAIFEESCVLTEYRKKHSIKPILPVFTRVFNSPILDLGKTAKELGGEIIRAFLVYYARDMQNSNVGCSVKEGLIMKHQGMFLVPLDSFQAYFDCKITVN